METKESRLTGFVSGAHRVIVTKPSIAGFGMNFQHCSHMAFTGLSDSYEQFYQALRRCWRFGQQNEVRCYVVTDSREGAVVRNIERKERDAMAMASSMVEHMRTEMNRAVHGTERNTTEYKPTKKMTTPSWLVSEGAQA
jgi:hypothetical protein